MKKLQEQYDAISSEVDGRLVKQVLSCIGFIAYAFLSGCRPCSCLRMKGGDLEILISGHSSDNVGEGLVALDDGDVAICIKFDQSKTRLPFQELLIADYAWEIQSIELIHAVVSDDRLDIGADGLLFDIGAADMNELRKSHIYRNFAWTVLTTAALECDVSVEVTLELVRKMYACSTLQDKLEAFDIGTSEKGSKRLRGTLRAYVKESLKDVSKRLGHGEWQARKMSPYVDPRTLVEFAHFYGYHRFSLTVVKNVIKVGGADHPWLSDSDEDDVDYKKAEDD